MVVLNDSKLVREAFRQPVFSGRPDTELTKLLQGYGMFDMISISINNLYTCIASINWFSN